jgi:mRNA-degrading endonuclease YafQ of YafQ-DinJ toxin-antitoxin module
MRRLAAFTDGTRSEPMYEARFTRQFLRATRKESQLVLRAALDEIAENPLTARGSHPLSYEWAGFRAADFAQGKRIMYRVCEECVQRRQQEIHPLDCCAIAGGIERTVTFVDFGDYHADAGRRRLRPALNYTVPEPDGAAEDPDAGPLDAPPARSQDDPTASQ